MRSSGRCVVLVLAWFGTLCMHAQYSVGKIVVRGAAPYTDAEVNAVAGLHAGQRRLGGVEGRV